MDQLDPKQKRDKLENFLLALAEMLDLEVRLPLRALPPEAPVGCAGRQGCKSSRR